MKNLRCLTWAGTASLVVALAAGVAGRQKDAKDQHDAKDQDRMRPRVTLKAAPVVSIAPSRVVLTAELVGGSNDYEEYYCPTVEWDWGDGTQSESTVDCEPYQPGKSEIKRRFTVEHVFRAGSYRVMFRMKRHEKSVAAATANIQVRPGIRDIGASQ
jgi:hypothetical protein